MEENKFNRQEDGTENTNNMSNAAPNENLETPAPAAREMEAQEGRMQSAGATNAPAKSTMLPIVGAVVVLILLAIGAYFLLGNDGGNPLLGGDAGSVQQQDGSGDLSFELSDVVARVNGEELYGSDLAYQMIQVAQQAGVQDLSTVDNETLGLIREQSLNAIVNTELLVQAARNEGLSVSPEEVETEYQSIIEGVGGQEVADERFEALGITEEEFRANLADDLIILDYIDTRGEAAALEVSEEEIQAFYDEVTQGQTEGVPPLADVRSQIEEQLQFQKEQEVLSSVIEDLRAGANIELLLGNDAQ